jgi:PAS domain S-box-containing protein
MTRKDEGPVDAAHRCKKAEGTARDHAGQLPENPRAMSLEEAQRTLHELRVRQIELETQVEELRRSQAKVEAERAGIFDLYDLAPVGYLTLSESGLILQANLTACTLLGVGRGALLEQPFSRFIVREDQDIHDLFHRQLVETGAPQVSDLRMLRGDAGRFWAHLAATAGRDADGVPTCRVVLSDATEHKRMEEALALSGLRFRLFADADPDFLFLKDLDLKYQMVNAANAAFLGRGETDILGRTDNDLMPAEAARACRESDLQAIRQKGIVIAIESVGDKVYETHKFPVIIEGEAVGVAGIIRDITKRKRAEEERTALEAQFQQAQKMESVGRLAGGVAHDFNNMLGVILGHAELALVDPTQPLHADLLAIRSAAGRSADLTRQLLAFARKQTVAPAVLDLNESVGTILTMLRRLIGEQIDLLWRPGENLWRIRVDPSQID